jgi:glycolate oxidase FAD binding subunit
MGASAAALGSAFADIVGAGHLLADGAAARFAVDGVAPRWVARPGTVGEVSRLLALAAGEGLAVAPRGSGAATALGNPPRRLDLVVDLSRLASVIEYVPEDMVATVQCGITLEALSARLGENGQMLALDPLGGRRRTVGGVLATDASGPLRFRYGTGRDLLLGIRFVQADGTLTWGGARVVKSVTGYDVPKLMVGALGTLGLLVEATVRLHPKPSAVSTLGVPFDSAEAAQAFVAALLDSTLEPGRISVLDAGARRACMGAGPAPVVLVSFGTVEEGVKGQGEALRTLAARSGSQAEWVPNAVWDSLHRELATPAEVQLRVACEITRVGHWLGEVERCAAALGLAVSVVGQAGNGIIQVFAGGGAALTPRLVRDMILPLRRGLEPEGGSLVVERAPAQLKRQCEVWGSIQPDSLEIMKRIKLEFDPGGILNPGRFVGGI